jgi:flagellar biogenesis protein FliO
VNVLMRLIILVCMSAWAPAVRAEAGSGTVIVAPAAPGVGRAAIAATQPAHADVIPAPTPTAVPPVVEQATNENVIRRRAETAPTTSPAATMALPQAATEAIRVTGALAAVVAVILVLRMVAGKVLGLRSAGVLNDRAVRVLSRTVMGAKQQLVLVQVGRRLVLLSDSGGRVSPVCEVTDPDEVAELAAMTLPASKRIALSGATDSFAGLLTSRRREYETVDAETPGGPAESGEPESKQGEAAVVSGAGSELAGLAAKVRALGRQYAPG